MKKMLLMTGLFIFCFGLASTTKEILGCITLPFDWILYLFGTTSHISLKFLMDWSKYLIMIGTFITVLALILLIPEQKPTKLEFHVKKWKPWKQRRILFQFFVASLILVHTMHYAANESSLPGVCPLSFAELGNFGVFGFSALFWLIVLALVFIFGRGLCGWACVYTPVQEQASSLLSAFGQKPSFRKFDKRWIILIFTALFWGTFVFNIVRHFDVVNLKLNNGLDVGPPFVFISGLLTMFPITLFLTHYFGSRFYCKYLCPIGGTMSLYNRFGLLKVRIDNAKCTGCKACYNNCEMGVEVAKYVGNKTAAITDNHCVVCGDCVDSCPTKALKLGFTN